MNAIMLQIVLKDTQVVSDAGAVVFDDSPSLVTIIYFCSFVGSVIFSLYGVWCARRFKNESLVLSRVRRRFFGWGLGLLAIGTIRLFLDIAQIMSLVFMVSGVDAQTKMIALSISGALRAYVVPFGFSAFMFILALSLPWSNRNKGEVGIPIND